MLRHTRASHCRCAFHKESLTWVSLVTFNLHRQNRSAIKSPTPYFEEKMALNDILSVTQRTLRLTNGGLLVLVTAPQNDSNAKTKSALDGQWCMGNNNNWSESNPPIITIFGIHSNVNPRCQIFVIAHINEFAQNHWGPKNETTAPQLEKCSGGFATSTDCLMRWWS